MTNLFRDNGTETAAGRYEWERVLRRIVMPWEIKGFGLLLSTYADRDGTRVRPGEKRLIAVTGKSESTVRRWTKWYSDRGLLTLTVRGGGRKGTGKTNTYRLSLPTDLLDRFQVLSEDDRPVYLASVPTDESPVTQKTGQSQESPVVQVTGDSDEDDRLTDHPDDRSTPNDNDFHRSNPGSESGMTGHLSGMTGHPDDRLPPTTPTTKDDHPPTPDPAQPATAREDDEPDHSEVDGEARASPRARCDHGLVPRPRSDGLPSCPFCRRERNQQPPERS